MKRIYLNKKKHVLFFLNNGFDFAVIVDYLFLL